MTKVDLIVMGQLCQYGGTLLTPLPDIDGMKLLRAIATVESKYGQWNVARHEMSYHYGGKYEDKGSSKEYGCISHCSLGPWQIMYPNARKMYQWVTPRELEESPFVALICTVAWINTIIIKQQGAKTIEAIADAYNSGNWRDSIIPSNYIGKVKKVYDNATN